MTQQRLDTFQVIGDPSSRKMLMLPSKNSLTINNLADNFDMSGPAVSKQIKILFGARLISIHDIGRERYCTLKTALVNCRRDLTLRHFLALNSKVGNTIE